jgi:hypothetical protein
MSADPRFRPHFAEVAAIVGEAGDGTEILCPQPRYLIVRTVNGG